MVGPWCVGVRERGNPIRCFPAHLKVSLTTVFAATLVAVISAVVLVAIGRVGSVVVSVVGFVVEVASAGLVAFMVQVVPLVAHTVWSAVMTGVTLAGD